MSLQGLRKELKQLQSTVKPSNSYNMIVYDPDRREGDDINLDAILEINGKDVSMLSDSEKQVILSKCSVHLCLPQKMSKN